MIYMHFANMLVGVLLPGVGFGFGFVSFLSTCLYGLELWSLRIDND